MTRNYSSDYGYLKCFCCKVFKKKPGFIKINLHMYCAILHIKINHIQNIFVPDKNKQITKIRNGLAQQKRDGF